MSRAATALAEVPGEEAGVMLLLSGERLPDVRPASCQGCVLNVFCYYCYYISVLREDINAFISNLRDDLNYFISIFRVKIDTLVLSHIKNIG